MSLEEKQAEMRRRMKPKAQRRNMRRTSNLDLGLCCEIGSRLTINEALRAGLLEAAKRLKGQMFTVKFTEK